MSCVCPHPHCFPLEDFIWWVSARRRPQEEKEAMQLVMCSVGRPVRLEGPEQGSWSYKIARTTEKHKFHRAHAATQGMCVNLINAPKLLANQQKDGDSPVRVIVPDLLEKSRQ